MPSAGPRLSKSRLIAAWQCPKRLYLEKFHPELAEITDKMEAMFAVGHEVGAVARSLYGTPESVEIPFDRKTSRMVEATREILASGARFPIFEATFRHQGILVRVEEPDEEAAIRMCRGVAGVLEMHHKVEILDEAIEALGSEIEARS